MYSGKIAVPPGGGGIEDIKCCSSLISRKVTSMFIFCNEDKKNIKQHVYLISDFQRITGRFILFTYDYFFQGKLILI
jgi:hypothetical protein